LIRQYFLPLMDRKEIEIPLSSPARVGKLCSDIGSARGMATRRAAQAALNMINPHPVRLNGPRKNDKSIHPWRCIPGINRSNTSRVS